MTELERVQRQIAIDELNEKVGSPWCHVYLPGGKRDPALRPLAEKILIAMAQSTVVEVSDSQETVKRAYALARSFLEHKG